jgi:hypothetical protein
MKILSKSYIKMNQNNPPKILHQCKMLTTPPPPPPKKDPQNIVICSSDKKQNEK